MRTRWFKKKVILGLLAFILAGFLGSGRQAPAAPVPDLWSPERVLQGLSGRYCRLNAFTAAYRRVASTPAMEQVFKSSSHQVATGIIYWARPDRLKLEQVSPQPELIVTDGSIVWWHLLGEHLVYRYRNVDVANEFKPFHPLASGPFHPLASGPFHPLASGPFHPLASGPFHPLASGPFHPLASGPFH